MYKYVYMFLYILILMFSTIFVWHKLMNKKINFKDKRLYLTLFGSSLTVVVNLLVTNSFLRIVVITPILSIFFKFLFKENLHKSIIIPIYTQLMTLASEIIYTMLLVIIFEDPESIINASFGTFLTNVVVALILVLLIQFKFVKTLYLKFQNATDKINITQLSLFGIILIMIINIVLVNSYYKIEFKYFLIFNIILICLFLSIIVHSFKTQNKYNKVSNKYNIAIKSLNDYENMMTKYRVANHENKNLLLTVRAMILNGDKDIPKYIDSMIEKKYLDDEKLLFKMSVIPSGGLRATIYSEILKIKDSKINYSLNIDRKIKTVDFLNLETDTIVEICKIIGVFIDNAIEEVKQLNFKNVDIELYIKNNKLCIKVSNNYKNKIDVSKIYEAGYTTKGKGHGYGLTMVKNIVDNNNIFENETHISKDIFSQVLLIKLKKHIRFYNK